MSLAGEMNPDLPAIEADGLVKSFGGIKAVDYINFSVRKGEIFGIVGPDGAGKTTTLRMLSGIMDPDSGQGRIDGLDTRTQSAAVKEHLAYMSQRFGLYPDLTVMENIRFYADLYGVPKKGRDERIMDLLGFSQMQAFTKRKAKDLSGGMKQKLQLVCALVHTPSVLLLDEPTNGVDPVSRRDFWRILRQLREQGVTILVTTAYLDEAERCGRIALLNQGRIMATGTLEELRKTLPGKVMALRSPEARSLHRMLKSALPGCNANLFGDAVHVVCSRVAETRDKILALAREHHIEIEGFEEIAPDLEDVFVSMMKEKHPTPGAAESASGAVGPSGQDVQNEYREEPQGKYPEKSLEDPLEKSRDAVTVTGLTRVFGKFVAVDQLSFTVPAGQIYGFLGPNGAGKSTTIRMLCGLLAPSSGSGTVAGFDVFTQSENIKASIGYMSQKFSLYEDLSVAENIRFYGGIYGLSGRRMDERFKWALDVAGLDGRSDSKTGQLSVGFKQRLALACALLHRPPIVFLDEPTSGVDPVSRRSFWDLIYQMAGQGTTVFVTTHYMEEAEYCDRIALIYRGKMVASGTPRELKLNHGEKRPDGSLPGMEEVFINLIEETDRQLVRAREGALS